MIESIYSQSFLNFELIVIDDGSNTYNLDLLNNISSKYKGIKLLYNNDNQGPLFSRLKAQKCASGIYLLFLDSDDCLLPEALKNLFFYLNDNEVDICFFDVLMNDKDIYKPFTRQTIKRDELLYNLLIDGLNAPLWNKCINRKLINTFDYSFANEVIHVRFGDDMLHSYIFYINSTKVTYYDCLIYKHVDNKHGLSKSFSVDVLQNKLTMRAVHYVFSNIEGMIPPSLFDFAISSRLRSIYEFLPLNSCYPKKQYSGIVKSTISSDLYLFLTEKNKNTLQKKHRIIKFIFEHHLYILFYHFFKLHYYNKIR